MMLILSVLAGVPVCLAASACMSAHSVWGWPLEPDLHAASGRCTQRFHGREKREGRIDVNGWCVYVCVSVCAHV